MPWSHFYQTRSAWSVDQGSTRKCSAVHNFAPTVTKFCVMWEGLSLPHDTKFGNVGMKLLPGEWIWSLIHGSSWSGLIKVGPGKPEWLIHVIQISYSEHVALTCIMAIQMTTEDLATRRASAALAMFRFKCTKPIKLPFTREVSVVNYSCYDMEKVQFPYNEFTLCFWAWRLIISSLW